MITLVNPRILSISECDYNCVKIYINISEVVDYVIGCMHERAMICSQKVKMVYNEICICVRDLDS